APLACAGIAAPSPPATSPSDCSGYPCQRPLTSGNPDPLKGTYSPPPHRPAGRKESAAGDLSFLAPAAASLLPPSPDSNEASLYPSSSLLIHSSSLFI
uniref:Uncharacterized protein n=1 Tax=Aegilops tauschii subsp. strangulata TaxID=200361 RepID=A0A452ZW72_AEGTS